MATKKTTAAAEEAKKATQAAQNDAQNVETTEGGQEYPAEKEAPEKAKTEPTNEPEGATTEPAEPDAAILTLDEIEALALPATRIRTRNLRRSAGE